MKSIRRRLLLWFLLGTGVLWLVGGAAVFFSYRAGLFAGVESELQSLLRQVRMNQMHGAGGGGGPGRGGPRFGFGGGMATAVDLGPDIYWQTWRPGGGASTRSENLADDLPRFDSDHGESIIRTEILQSGIRVMVAGARFGMGGGMGGGGVEISVARNLGAVDQALSRMLLGILLTGLAVAGVAVLWVLFVLRGGLAPLRRIADEVAAIDTGSLSGRIGDDDLPDELAPIVSRLNELMARLETSFSRERRFSSDLAHEMRTPVAELRLLAESAVKWPEEGGREAWDAVIGSVDRMELVVQAMLQLARLEQASPGRLGESLALSPLVLKSWAAHHTRAAARGITLHLDIEPDATVTGDPALWRHILGNLLGNAADYADEGSEVVVSTERTMTQNGLVVCVANSATALAPGDIDRLFDRFWRGDTARTESSHCGLGLPLARACGEAMGWRLRALPRPEDGWLEMRIEPGGEPEE